MARFKKITIALSAILITSSIFSCAPKGAVSASSKSTQTLKADLNAALLILANQQRAHASPEAQGKTIEMITVIIDQMKLDSRGGRS